MALPDDTAYTYLLVPDSTAPGNIMTMQNVLTRGPHPRQIMEESSLRSAEINVAEAWIDLTA